MRSYEQLKTLALLGPVAVLFVVGFLLAVSSGAATAGGGVSIRGMARNVPGILAKVCLYVVAVFGLQMLVGYRG